MTSLQSPFVPAAPSPRLRRWAGHVGALAGWRRAGVAIGLGAVSALALPPVHALPLLWICFPVLVWLIDGARRDRGAFWVGWGWGTGHFAASLYWIANALMLDPEKFGWMIPFAVGGLGAVLGLFVGLAAYGARRLAPAGAARVLILAGLWVVGEWVRSWLFTGFSWNMLGTVWMPALPVVQLAALAGAYGLSLLAVLVFAMPAVLATGPLADRRTLAAVFALLALVAGWGWLRLPAGPQPTQPGVTLRLVQGNIEQTVKWAPELRAAHLREYLNLSAAPGWDKLSAVIWPETAVPFLVEQEPMVRRLLAQSAPPGGLLITGVPRATPEGVEPFQIWNSLQAFDKAGQIVGSFDKAHLVPFGEYVPLGKYLPLAKVTAGRTDFTPGPGPARLTLPGLPPVAPSICYEDIFPAAVVATDQPRPTWLLNVTNDGWFGNSAGPYQHFAAARLRAVEEGLPMVRVGNTGVTGVVDPYGRVVASLPLGTRAILDATLPLSLFTTSPFAILGNWVVLILSTGIAASAVVYRMLTATRRRS